MPLTHNATNAMTAMVLTVPWDPSAAHEQRGLSRILANSSRRQDRIAQAVPRLANP